MSEETLLTAARRVVRYVRSDDHAHGGLLSKDTIKAVETLDAQLSKAAKAIRRDGEIRIAGEDHGSPPAGRGA